MATLVVAATLLVCALLPRALRDATVLLQYRTAQLEERTPRMNSSRQMLGHDPMFHHPPELITAGTCKVDHGVKVEDECKAMAEHLGIWSRRGGKFRVLGSTNSKNPAGCFLFKNKLFFNPNMASTLTAEAGNRPRSLICGPPSAERIYNGTCDEDLVPTRAECHRAAFYLGLIQTPPWGPASSTEFRVKSIRNPKWPKGCFQHRGIVFYNTRGAANGDCGITQGCICNEELSLAVGPPAYPITGGSCPAQGTVAEADCKASVEALGYEVSSYIPTTFDANLPPGCILSSTGRTLKYNHATSSTACDRQNQCICSGEYPRAYFVMRGTCQKNDVLDVSQCRIRAAELHYEITSEEMDWADTNFPSGCFVLKKKLVFNTVASAAPCAADRHCICATNAKLQIR